MHSPPVQPISSSTSGTGSVITMWLEVSVSRRRSGGSRPAHGPAASTAAPARTRPPAVSTSTPPGARAHPPRRASARRPHAGARASLLAQAVREARGWTVAAPGKKRAAAEAAATRSAPATSAASSEPARVGLAQLRARRDEPAPASRRAAGVVETAGSRRGRNQASTPCSSHHRPTPSTAAGRGAGDGRAPRVAEARAQRRQAEPHLVDEAAVAPARARPADARPRAATTSRLGLELLAEPGRPHPRVAAADDRPRRRGRRRSSGGSGSTAPASACHQPCASCRSAMVAKAERRPAAAPRRRSRAQPRRLA